MYIAQVVTKDRYILYSLAQVCITITIWLKTWLPTLVILSYNSYIYEFCAIYYKGGRINVMPRGKLRNMEDFILLFMQRLILIRVLNLLLSNNNLSKRGRRNEALFTPLQIDFKYMDQNAFLICVSMILFRYLLLRNFQIQQSFTVLCSLLTVPNQQKLAGVIFMSKCLPSD